MALQMFKVFQVPITIEGQARVHFTKELGGNLHVMTKHILFLKLELSL